MATFALLPSGSLITPSPPLLPPPQSPYSSSSSSFASMARSTLITKTFITPTLTLRSQRLGVFNYRRAASVVCEAQDTTAAVQVAEVTDTTWKSLVLGSDTPVLVEFWAPWCGPCRMIHPVVDELAKEYAGKLQCYKLNTDQSPSIATEYGIRSIPTVMIFKNGEKKDAVIGAVPKTTLTTSIDNLSSSRVFKSREIEHQTSNISEAEPSDKLKFSGGIGIGIGIGEGSGAGSGEGDSIDFGKGSGSGSGVGGGIGIGIGIGIGGGIEWRAGGKSGSGRPSECFVCGREVSSSGRCCPYKEAVGEECPSECFECQHSESGKCCPVEVTRKLQHERALAGQKTVEPLVHEDEVDHAWAPSN